MVLSVAGEPPSPGEEGLTRRLRDAHLGSLAAGITAVLVALKVLAVAHYQTTTAFGILAESGTASLVVGALVQTLPLVLLATLFGLVVAADDESTPTADRRLLRSFAWIMAVLSAWALPAWLALLVLGITWLLLLGPGASRLLLGLLGGLWGRGDRARQEKVEQAGAARKAIQASREASIDLRADFDRTEQALHVVLEEPSKTTVGEPEALLDRLTGVQDRLEAEADARVGYAERAAALMHEVHGSLQQRIRFLEAARPVWRNVERGLAVTYVIAAVAIGGLGSQPWLPAERISVDGQPAVTGYVLAAAQNDAVVLVEKTRQVIRLQGSVRRRYCTLQRDTSGINRPLGAMLHPASSYPACRNLAP